MIIEKIILYTIFILLVVVPTYHEREMLGDRLEDIRQNKDAVLYLFIIMPIFFITYAFSVFLAMIFPILRFGWLGENIVFYPLRDLTVLFSTNGVISQGVSRYILILVLLEVIITSIIAFNYYEEEVFRDSYKDVGVWAVLHMIMGIPLFAVIPIFSLGVIFKKIRDKKGLEKAYTAHVFTNIFFILVIVSYLAYYYII